MHTFFLKKFYLSWFRLYQMFNKILCKIILNIPLSLRGMSIGAATHFPISSYITWPHRVSIGDGCIVNPGFVCREYSSGDLLKKSVIIGNKNYFDHNVKIIMGSSSSLISIGEGNFFGANCQLSSRSSIFIEDNCQFAAGCHLVDFNHGKQVGAGPMASQPCEERSIVIQSDVWLGTQVVVLMGVTIGTGAIVGAGALVTKSIPPYEIWAGIPAKKVGERS